MSDNEATDAPVSQPSFSLEGKTFGRVKWFNNKVGYGFITTCDEEQMDVFVHHSQIVVATQQYKYLVEGEYVHFKLSEATDSEHKHLAAEVSGINGGKLMCETRALQQEARTNVEESGDGAPRRARGGGGGRGNRRSYNPQQFKLVRRDEQEEV